MKLQISYYLFFFSLITFFFGCENNSKASSEVKDNNTNTEKVVSANMLSEAEKEAGWKLLFDGKTTNGWRGYNHETFPTIGWKINEAGSLTVSKSGTEEAGFGGDIITVDKFENFELLVDFMVSDTGNSGIFYRVLESKDQAIWQNAPEYQVLDNQTYINMYGDDMKTHLTGDDYDLQAAPEDYSKPVGEWNTAKIVINNNKAEYWLNGKKTIDTVLESPEWEALVAKSKFKDYPQFGRTKKGHIGLQDHGHLVKFRNIKIREL